jgi:hypothetical protein
VDDSQGQQGCEDNDRALQGQEKLWQTIPRAGAKAIKHVPNILAIPLSAVRLFNLHKKGKMPHESLDLLKRHISNPNIGEDKDKWNLVRDWLITATYRDGKKKKKSSVIRIDIEGVTCNNDEV